MKFLIKYFYVTETYIGEIVPAHGKAGIPLEVSAVSDHVGRVLKEDTSAVAPQVQFWPLGVMERDVLLCAVQACN